MVNWQPNPRIFFKVFLELRVNNMLSMLAFDRRSVGSLLDGKNSAYFSAQFPIIFKNVDGQTAIDKALEANQIASVNLMVEYVVNYQNTYVFAHLFEHNLIDMMNRGGIVLRDLFDSEVFNLRFDYD